MVRCMCKSLCVWTSTATAAPSYVAMRRRPREPEAMARERVPCSGRGKGAGAERQKGSILMRAGLRAACARCVLRVRAACVGQRGMGGGPLFLIDMVPYGCVARGRVLSYYIVPYCIVCVDMCIYMCGVWCACSPPAPLGCVSVCLPSGYRSVVDGRGR